MDNLEAHRSCSTVNDSENGLEEIVEKRVVGCVLRVLTCCLSVVLTVEIKLHYGG